MDFTNFADYATKIAQIYAKEQYSPCSLEYLREAMAFLIVQFLIDSGNIPPGVVEKSQVFKAMSGRFASILRKPSMRQIYIELVHSNQYQKLACDAISFWSTLRDQLWMLGDSQFRERGEKDRLRWKKLQGIYETPLVIAKFITQLILHFRDDIHAVLDPASGSGNLLQPFWKSGREIDTYGIDIDNVGLLFSELAFLLGKKTGAWNNCHFSPLYADFLASKTVKPVDAIISNPPWGISPSELEKYDREDFPASFTRQADSWALFLEKSLILLKANRGILAFIIPNTLCLNPNFEKLRFFLLQESTILFILNLGENVFPWVNQPSLIFVTQASTPPPHHTFRVGIVPKGAKGLSDLPQSPQGLRVYLQERKVFSQEEFLKEPGFRFELFGSKSVRELILKIRNSCTHSFGDFVTNARGVEIGKKAEVIQCPYCSRWNPPPKWKDGKASCNHCNEIIDHSERLVTKRIIEKQERSSGKVASIIVGEQIAPFQVRGHSYIHLDLNGINYKSSRIYSSPKIVVRKTGREINAAIDWDDRLTVQVVYIFQKKITPPVDLPIEILLCILNSDILLFYYYHRFGDPEKHSYAHYIQKHLKLLPIPPLAGNPAAILALAGIREIIEKYPKFGQGGVDENDIRSLNQQINALFNLTSEEIAFITHWVATF